jgi:GntR family transcriptional regulator, transcriptional repressor for pyruvate dehydrogenase complex
VRRVLQDLFAVRLIMEPEASAVVAANRSDHQLAAIRETVERLERLGPSPSREVVVRADRDFHWNLALATGNQVLTSIMRSVEALLWRKFGLAATLFDPQDRVLPQHRAIYQAIAAGDSNAAREDMRVHLTDARDRLLQALPS